MTRFKVVLKTRVITHRFFRRSKSEPVVHVAYGKGYAVSEHAVGIKRLVVYNDENRHVFTADWDAIECIYMDDVKIETE